MRRCIEDRKKQNDTEKKKKNFYEARRWCSKSVCVCAERVSLPSRALLHVAFAQVNQGRSPLLFFRLEEEAAPTQPLTSAAQRVASSARQASEGCVH